MAEKSPKEIQVITVLTDFRKKVIEQGEDAVTDEELKEAIALLRSMRDTTAMPLKEKAVKRATKAVTKKNADDFFGDLLGEL